MSCRPDAPAWSLLLDAHRAAPDVPLVAVINPNSGPGEAADPGFVALIARLKEAGIRSLGYLPTGYGRRPLGRSANDLTRYHYYYPGLDGLFFDEMSGRHEDAAYYHKLADGARARGARLTVGNPGTDVSPSLVGIFDLLLVYEEAGLPAALPDWLAAYDPGRFGLLAHSVATLDEPALLRLGARAGWRYVTAGTLPDPWCALSSHLPRLLALGQ